MSGKGSPVVDFFGVYDNRINERLDAALKHQSLSQSVHKKDHQGTKRLRITGLDSTPGGACHVLAFPTRYRPVSRFVRAREGETLQHSFVLPVDTDRVVSVDIPEFENLADDLKAVLQASHVEGGEGARGADLKPETLEFMIDADIDDASGIEHIFQVIRPWLTGKNTNPYDVHEILIAYQKIDPMYRLVV